MRNGMGSISYFGFKMSSVSDAVSAPADRMSGEEERVDDDGGGGAKASDWPRPRTIAMLIQRIIVCRWRCFVCCSLIKQ